MQNILGVLAGGAKHPRIFTGSAKYPRLFDRGYQISYSHGGTSFLKGC